LVELFAGGAGTELEGGDQLAGFGEAEAGLAGELADAGAAEGTDRSVVLQQFAADLDGAAAFHAGAEEEGEQFGVVEGGGAEFRELFAGALVLGEVTDPCDHGSNEHMSGRAGQTLMRSFEQWLSPSTSGDRGRRGGRRRGS
jgi:hypothetical protein